MSHGSRVMCVMGQITDGSDWSWVKNTTNCHQAVVTIRRSTYT